MTLIKYIHWVALDLHLDNATSYNIGLKNLWLYIFRKLQKSIVQIHS